MNTIIIDVLLKNYAFFFFSAESENTECQSDDTEAST